MSGGSPSPEFSLELIALLPRLRRYAVVLTRDRDAADDLVQDTLERAWTRHRQWHPGTDLRAWLFTIMHNRRVDLFRAEHAGAATGADPADEGLGLPSPVAPGDPDSAIDAIDLQRGFDALASEHREVLLLVAVEQMSYEQAAQALDVPIGTVMSRLSRARARLRDALAAPPANPTAHRLSRIK